MTGQRLKTIKVLGDKSLFTNPVISSDVNGDAIYVEGGGGTSAIIVDIKTNDYTVISDDQGKLLEFDTTLGNITLTLPLTTSMDDGFNFRFKNTGTGLLNIIKTGGDTVNSTTTIVVNEGEIYGISNDLDTNNWSAYMKEINSIIGDVSHIVGFWTEGNILYVDVGPMTGGEVIDIAKYNLFFTDGTPSYKMVAGAVDSETALSQYGVHLIIT